MTTPARFGRYEVIELLGQGAMGAVYKAQDPAIDRLVAVKTMGGPVLAFPEHREEFLARFRQEARAAGRLSHPGIVSIHDVGVDESTSTPFIVMEYVPGTSLAKLLEDDPVLPLDRILEIVEQIGLALEEAHQHGVVHRDVKPGNIFLDTRGRVKVGDFGIARLEGSDITRAGVGLGTPGYVAPEVLRGGKADARSDLFSLAVLAYMLLAGRRPFVGRTGQDMGLQVLSHDPDPPHLLRPEVPLPVSEAVMRGLAKDPDRRTPSVARFLEELSEARTMEPPALAEPSVGARGVLLAAVALGVVVLLIGGTLLALRARPREALRTPTAASPAARPPATAAARPTAPPTPPATPVPTAKAQKAGRKDREPKGGVSR